MSVESISVLCIARIYSRLQLFGIRKPLQTFNEFWTSAAVDTEGYLEFLIEEVDRRSRNGYSL